MNIKNFISKYKKFFAVLIGTVILAVCGIFFLTPKEEVVAQEKVYSVKTMPVSSVGNDVYLNYAGLIQPAEMEKASLPTIGEITNIYVKEGDVVTKGQALFRIDSSRYESRRDTAYHTMQSAEASKNSAQAALDFAQKAYNEAVKAPTQEEKDKAKENLEKAKENERLKQEEYDKVKDLLMPYETEANNAQVAYDTARQKYKDAYAKNEEIKQNEDSTEEEKLARQKAVEDAKIEVGETEKVLREKLSALAEAQLNLGFAEKEAQLAQAKADTALKQREFDKANKVPAQSDIDVAAKKSRLDTAKFTYDSALAGYEAAKGTYDASQKAVDDCVYHAGMSGKVVKVVGEKGGMSTPIMPVMVIGSTDMVAQFGISQTDIKDVSVGLPATITINGEEYTGQIKKISTIPDQASRTYTTDVVLTNSSRELKLGELASVKIGIGERKGIWLPISAVMNDGQDYVFTVENGRALRKNVVITDISNDMIRVTGLEDTKNIIYEGMKTIKSGNSVNVIGDK